MEIKTKLVEKFNVVQVSQSFKKREFVVEYAENTQYPEFIKFELIQDKCELLDGFDVGQEIVVNFNLKGRKWINPKGETLYFNSLQAWKLAGFNNSQKVSQANEAPIDDELPPLEAYSPGEAYFEE